jgi:hypothetical protein
VVRELGSLDAYAAYLTSKTQGPAMRKEVLGLTGLPADEQNELRLLWDPAGRVLLRPYRLLAVGQCLDANGPFLAVVLLHDSEKAARENADLLKQRIATSASIGGKKWADLVRDVETEADGDVLIAKLYGYLGFTDFLNRADPLLLHE